MGQDHERWNREREEETPSLGLGSQFRKEATPRFAVDLPLEYYRTEAPGVRTGRAMNASEGGLLIYFPERMEIGQHLHIKLYFTSGSDLTVVESLVEIVWIDLDMGQVG